MARYLIAFVCCPQADLEYFPKVFSVSNNCSPYDVTVPDNTLFYTFVQANVKTANELAESFLAFNLGNMLISHHTIPFEKENDGKRYFIGKLGNFLGNDGIFNPKTNTFILANTLSEIDEVIDM